MRSNGIACGVLDLNLHCLLAQFDHEVEAGDTWSRRARNNRHRNLVQLRAPELYQSFDRYQRVINDLGRLLSLAGRKSGCEITLANYHDPQRSPLSSADLLASAEQFEDNHFYPLFSSVIEEALAVHQPVYVGLSLSYLSQALPAFAVAGFLRRHHPQIRIIAGGGLISSWMSSPAWSEPFRGLFDYCIAGPGEKPLLQLCGQESDSALGRFCYDDYTMTAYLSPGAILPYSASHGCYWQKCQF